MKLLFFDGFITSRLEECTYIGPPFEDTIGTFVVRLENNLS
jgi:hypothetical protein